MRAMILLATWTLVGAMLIVAGIWLILPDRNRYGDPRAEVELASCVLPDDTQVRLYEGDADSVSWYSVTHDPPWPQRERQIVYRRSPRLYDLVCDSAGVIVRTDSAPITLTATEATRLRQWMPSLARVSVTRLLSGALLVIAGAALLYFLRPTPGDAPEEEEE
jgi:hypothetical protein